MQTDDTRKLYSPNSAARALDVSRSKIYDLMKSGAVRFVMIDSDRRIPSDEIERLSIEGSTRSTQIPA